MPNASSGPKRHSGGKTRRRGAALEDALLEAAWGELQAVGYADLTMEAVADRAGTSRAVLYRRWRNRTELVLAATRRYRPRLSGEIPDTGSLRGDVVALLTRASDRMAEGDIETVYGMMSEYLADPELFSSVQDQLSLVGPEVMATILKRAEARGEVRAGISPRVASLPIALLRHELLQRRSAPSKVVIAEIVDDVFLPLVQE